MERVEAPQRPAGAVGLSGGAQDEKHEDDRQKALYRKDPTKWTKWVERGQIGLVACWCADILGVRYILEKSRQNWKDEAYAYGVEGDRGKDNDKGSVHKGGNRGRQRVMRMGCPAPLSPRRRSRDLKAQGRPGAP